MEKETHTGTVTTLTSEGQGIIRHNGLVVFIPFTAPGDTVRYSIEKTKRNFAQGSLQEIITPSPLRTFPRCPYFGTCGGCQLQHLTYAEQIDAKRQWIDDAIKRIGNIADVSVPPVVAATDQWAYRRRINLVIKPKGNIYQAGYISVDNTSLLPTTECPIFAPIDDPVISSLQNFVRMLKPANNDDARATLLKSGHETYIVHFDFKLLPDNIEDALSHLAPSFESITFSSPKKHLQFGKANHTFDIDGLTISFSPKAFIQAHAEQSLNIYKAIEATAQKQRPNNVLDLYCGIGISSLFIARHDIPVTGIEFNSEAIRLAKHNAKANKITNAQFLTADVGKILEKHLKENTYEFAIINPPREGLTPEILKILTQQPIKTLIYISCMPSTLARDLKTLCQNKYSIASVQGYDMFPQTIHVETMVICSD